MKIADVLTTDAGTTVEFIGQVYEMEPNKYPSGKTRVVYKLQDETGKIWSYYWGSPIPDLFIDTWIKVTGKVSHYLKPPHTTPLVTVTWEKEDMEILTGGESLPQPEIGFSSKKYLPTNRELAQKYHVLYSFYEDLKRLFGEAGD